MVCATAGFGRLWRCVCFIGEGAFSSNLAIACGDRRWIRFGCTAWSQDLHGANYLFCRVARRRRARNSTNTNGQSNMLDNSGAQYNQVWGASPRMPLTHKVRLM